MHVLLRKQEPRAAGDPSATLGSCFRRSAIAGGDGGFTLIELMISLGLFALIAVAGVALVDGIIKVQGRTEVRLDRLADIQRTMFVMTSDLDQIARGRISGGGTTLSFTRAAPGQGGPPVALKYIVAGGALVRTAASAAQPLLSGVTAARWRFWDGQWLDRWPRDEKAIDRWPRAVAIELSAQGPGGGPAVLRRVVALPVRPEEPPQP